MQMETLLSKNYVIYINGDLTKPEITISKWCSEITWCLAKASKLFINRKDLLGNLLWRSLHCSIYKVKMSVCIWENSSTPYINEVKWKQTLTQIFSRLCLFIVFLPVMKTFDMQSSHEKNFQTLRHLELKLSKKATQEEEIPQKKKKCHVIG